jgi:hypothetical protein
MNHGSHNNDRQEIIMSDEITIKPKSEPVAPGNTSAKDNRTSLINLCALGLGVSFFLPWVNFLGATPSGLDLQKLNGWHRFLWLIPICSAITIFAGLTKRNQKHVAEIAGLLPFIVGGYWYYKLGNDLLHMLALGGILSLVFGAALLTLPRSKK